jgi:redox-sensitive bicupin YhaK (pirin superfamily)
MADRHPDQGARRVRRVVRGRPARDGDGVKLTRVIGSPALPELDPFLLLDEIRSDEAGDYGGGFPSHPHRGFETVTYLIAGRMRHADNQGNQGLLRAGSVQWMTAGRGIVHSEMPEQEGGLLWGFQLWVNLPAREKMTAPRYQDIDPEDVPEVEVGGVRVRVVAGALGDARGPVVGVSTEPVFLDVSLPPGSSFAADLPRDHAAFAFVCEGAARVGPSEAATAVAAQELAVLGPGERAEVAALAVPARLLLVAGRPLGEPVARYGPFVMNTDAEIRRAIQDFQGGRL